MNLQNVIEFFTKAVPYPNLKGSNFHGEWKNSLLLVLLGNFILLGPFAFIPAAMYSIQTENWALLGLNTVVISTMFFVAFSKRLINSEIKVQVSIGIFFILGIAVLVLLGPVSSGLLWMFLFVILAGLFYGYKGILITEILSCISLGVLAIPIYFESKHTPNLNLFGFYGWLVNIVLFTTISLFISYLLNEIIINIETSLKKEQKITDLLYDNQKKLAKEKLRAEEADMLKSKFLANMSHEIRTPLNSILGFTSLMAEPGLDEVTLKNFNNIIKTSGEQLLGIINDIIDISKIESNQLTLHIQSVDIYRNLMEIIQIAENKIKTHNKKLSVNLEVNKKLMHLFLETDELRFKQIISNLVDNSIKYSKEGTITIGYHFIDYKNSPSLEFYIKDTGRGIPPDALNSIFDRFAQANNIDFHEGTGLGLSIVKGLLDLLGGSIRVESEINKGSTFYIALPYIGKVIPEMYDKQEEKPENLHDYSGKTFIIAEDDLASYYFLKEVLKPTNVKLIHAVNGKKLLELLETQIPDLILLDINMPVMNGFEALQEIRKRYNNVKIIAQTAYAMAEEKQMCFKLGCNEYISKPIKKGQLFETIDLLLKS